MNAVEALAYFNWVPPCECRHDHERHDGEGAGSCREKDSYGLPCTCPSYDVEPDESAIVEAR